MNKMMLSCLVLFGFAVSKVYAQEQWWNAGGTEITCRSRITPISVVDDKMKWGSNVVHNVHVCVQLNARIMECEQSKKSYIKLTLYHPDESKKLNVSFRKNISLAEIVKDNHFKCYTFEARDILDASEGKDLLGAKVKAEAVLWANKDTRYETGGRNVYKFQVHLRFNTLLATEAGDLAVPIKPKYTERHQLYIVICKVRNCEVIVTEPSEVNILKTTKEIFTVKEGQVQKYKEPGALWDDETFSVHTFECGTQKCPTKFLVKETAKAAIPPTQAKKPTTETETVSKNGQQRTDKAGASNPKVNSSDPKQQTASGRTDGDIEVSPIVLGKPDPKAGTETGTAPEAETVAENNQRGSGGPGALNPNPGTQTETAARDIPTKKERPTKRPPGSTDSPTTPPEIDTTSSTDDEKREVPVGLIVGASLGVAGVVGAFLAGVLYCVQGAKGPVDLLSMITFEFPGGEPDMISGDRDQFVSLE